MLMRELTPEELEKSIRREVGKLADGDKNAQWWLRFRLHPLINEHLLPLLDHPDPQIRHAAIFGLGSNGNHDVVPSLLDRLNNPVDGPAVAESLGRIGDQQVIEPLLSQLSATPDMDGLKLALSKFKTDRVVGPILAAERQKDILRRGHHRLGPPLRTDRHRKDARNPGRFGGGDPPAAFI